MKNTRRDILKMAGIGAGAVAVDALSTKANASAGATVESANKSAHAAATAASRSSIGIAAPPASSATTEVTDKSGKRLAAGAPVTWTKIAKSAAPSDVVVDPSKKLQTVLGFGAAFTDGSCYTVSRLADADRAKLLTQMFGQGADQGCLSTGRIRLARATTPPRATATTTAWPIRR